MDGVIARLPASCARAERNDVMVRVMAMGMVMVEASHAIGFIGATGRGTPESAVSKDAWTSTLVPSARPLAALPAAASRGSPRAGTGRGEIV